MPGRSTLPATSRFRDVWFRYGSDAWTLRDVSFAVPSGSKTALVGETGSGKRRSATSRRASTTSTRGASRSAASTYAT